MRIFKDYNQKQTFLLPPSVEEFVPVEHPARIISDVIDTIDLNSIVGEYSGGGSTAYHPAMMLKALIYAYSQGIYSSRRIERCLISDTALKANASVRQPGLKII